MVIESIRFLQTFSERYGFVIIHGRFCQLEIFGCTFTSSKVEYDVGNENCLQTYDV
jgi:hypothetical protein